MEQIVDTAVNTYGTALSAPSAELALEEFTVQLQNLKFTTRLYYKFDDGQLHLWVFIADETQSRRFEIYDILDDVESLFPEVSIELFSLPMEALNSEEIIPTGFILKL